MKCKFCSVRAQKCIWPNCPEQKHSLCPDHQSNILIMLLTLKVMWIRVEFGFSAEAGISDNTSTGCRVTCRGTR